MNGVVNQVLGAPGLLVIGLVGFMVFAEDALFVGFVIPGETAALLGGVAANHGHVPLAAVITVVIAAAVVGDSVGYEVGKHFGPRLLRWHVLDSRRKRLDEAQDFLARRGGTAVLLGRWIAFFRAVMPALAGTARMPYLKFLAFNACGGVIWGAAVVIAGYLAGASYAQVEKTLGRVGGLLALTISLLGLLIWRIHKSRKETRAAAE